jgi:signal recognition particle receptor subunit beta
MEQQLQELHLQGIPIVVQFNKQDLPDAAPVGALQRAMRLNGQPVCESVAVEGKGVFDTLKAIVGKVMVHVQQQLVTAR